MRLEIRCPKCGRGYLIDEAKLPPGGGRVPCKACGTSIDLPERAASSAGPSQQPPPAARPSPPPVASPPLPASAPASRPAPTATTPSSGSRASDPSATSAAEVVCPRCGLHFASAKGAVTAPGPSRPIVLVVEDMDYFLEIAKDALSPKYEVKTARSLREARAALSSGRIDLILLDLTLEDGESGLTLLEEMPVKPCPVLIFTAEDESEMYGESWDRLRALGADDLVIKGINVGESLARKSGALLGESEPEEPTGR